MHGAKVKIVYFAFRVIVTTKVIIPLYKMNKARQSKAIPVQAQTGPEVFRRLKPPDFKTIGPWRW
jgi:hypothetical protein